MTASKQNTNTPPKQPSYYPYYFGLLLVTCGLWKIANDTYMERHHQAVLAALVDAEKSNDLVLKAVSREGPPLVLSPSMEAQDIDNLLARLQNGESITLIAGRKHDNSEICQHALNAGNYKAIVDLKQAPDNAYIKTLFEACGLRQHPDALEHYNQMLRLGTTKPSVSSASPYNNLHAAGYRVQDVNSQGPMVKNPCQIS